jgi:hypothetical protein
MLSQHTSETISHMSDLCRQFRSSWIDHLLGLSPSKMNFPKFHLVEHATRQITLFGAGDVCNVEAMEAAHKEPKATYRRLNKQVRLCVIRRFLSAALLFLSGSLSSLLTDSLRTSTRN